MTDLTEGVIWKNILKYSIPILIANTCSYLFSAVDSAIIGNVLGANSLAAVTCTGGLVRTLRTVQTFAVGSAILISHSYGARNFERVKKSILTIGVIILLMIMVLIPTCLLNIDRLLIFVNVDSLIWDEAKTYFKFMILWTGLHILYSYIHVVIQALGISKPVLYSSIISSGINIILDLLLVNRFGVLGVSVATFVAGIFQVLCLIPYFVKVIKELKFSKDDFTFDRYVLGMTICYGIPRILQSLCINVGNLALQMELNKLGVDYIVVRSICFNLFILIEGIVFSYDDGVKFCISQAYGAKKKEVYKKCSYSYFIISSISLLVMSVIYFALEDIIMRLFVNNPTQVAEMIFKDCMRVNVLCYILLIILLSFRVILSGTGKITIVFISTAIEFVVRLACAYAIPYYGFSAFTWHAPLSWVAAGVFVIPMAVHRYKQIMNE